MVAGRPYQPSDTVKEFVVNESLVKQLGILNPQEILGKKMEFFGWMKGTVVGVVKDFNSGSMKFRMTPVVMAPWKYVYGTIAVKLGPCNLQQTLAAIQKIWTATYPDYVYKYQFLDDSIAAYYEQENQLSQLYKIFAGIAIFISCLGVGPRVTQHCHFLPYFHHVQRTTMNADVNALKKADFAHYFYYF